MRYCALHCLVASLVLTSLIGCGRGNSTLPGSSDPAQAKQSLANALDAWRSGAKPDSVSGAIVSDEEWAGGIQLLNYELQDDAKPHGNSIRQKATLEVRGPGGNGLRKTALYQISTNPRVTISRSDALEDEAGSGTAVRKTRE